jgi:methionine-rich copper-binding protein CopC
MNRGALFVFSAVVGIVAPAFAHAFLQHASPSAGETLKPPKEVTLQFTESLEPAFSGVDVTDASGRNVEAAKVVTNEGAMRVLLMPLAPGSYRVGWHAVSVDTHRTEGSYRFIVKP